MDKHTKAHQITRITEDDTPTQDELYTALWFDKVLTPAEQRLMLMSYEDQLDAVTPHTQRSDKRQAGHQRWR